MTEETKAAMELVIAHLDAMMEETPSRETADVCNFLQKLLDEAK